MSVGKRQRKLEGRLKATGAAVYTDDLALPRMLHAKTVRSSVPHARLLGVDFAEALKVPGVVATLVGAELPERYGVIPWTQDEQALAVDKVRFIGDPVAVVAATSERAAEEAVRLVRVAYDPLPALLDPDEALARTDVLVHDERGPRHQDNVTKSVALSFGAVDEAFGRSAIIADETFFYEGSTHAPIEPHCAVATWDGTRLTLWSATQIPHYVHRTLAKVLGLSQARVRVIQPYLGGAFGGKSDPFSLELCAAKLAMKTGRPVKMLYTREEVFYAHRGRHPMKMRFRVGLAKDGAIEAVESKIVIDGGAYASFGLVTAYYSGQLLTGPYRFGTYRFDSTRVYTNKPPCGPKRGHGSVQPRFAFECALDMAATSLGIDPIEVRRKNFIGEDATTVNGQRITSNGFPMCLDAVERASGWKERRGKLGFGRGLGVAGSMYISGTAYPVYPNEMPQSGVLVKLDRSGRVAVYSGASDIGQGINTLLAQIPAEELGCDPDDVTVVAADTDLTPVDLGAYSSRVTYMVGLAAIEACRKLRAQLDEASDASEQFAVRVQKAEAKFGTLAAAGSYRTQKLGADYRGGTIGASPAYSFTAHVAEVSVDPETGVWKVVKLWAAHDCGKALNPTLVEGQIEGSVYMGAAEAQMEAHTVDDRGLLRAPNLLDYRIPTTLDTPDIASIIVESDDPNGPYGAKEAGEGPLHPAIPAIANAIYDAVGVRLTRLPFSPAAILKALRERERADADADADADAGPERMFHVEPPAAGGRGC